VGGLRLKGGADIERSSLRPDGVPGKVVLSTIDGQKLTKAIALDLNSFLGAGMVILGGDRTPSY